jgi:maltose alpha-D-glucosyltransferase/alpha-amylase
MVPNVQDFWAYTLDMLSRYFDRVHTASAEVRLEPLPEGSIVELAGRQVPEKVVGLLGTYLELARLLGQRTAEMHLALASAPDNRDFAPEPFTPFYQRGLFQSMRNLVVENLGLLRSNLDRLPPAVRPQAELVAAFESDIIKRLRAVHQTPLSGKRIRCHGDFHLGEALYTGKDFVFIDFEGERERPIGERRIKRSPLFDIAAMIRSLNYVTYAALFKQLELGALREDALPQVEPWATFWHRWVSAVYLKACLDGLAKSELLPASKEQLSILLQAHLLEKAIYEIGYELTHRPAWTKIPLQGVLAMMGAPAEAKRLAVGASP